MRTRIAFITVIILCFFIAVSCKREYSYEGGDGAVYSFVGAPDSCTEAIVHGNFYKGIPVDTSNAVQLLVHVSKAGTYTIKTDAVNGIGFSLTGRFADTGIQALILPAKGAPDVPGTFQVKIPGDNGCYFPLTVAPPQPSSYSFDGAPEDCAGTTIKGIYIAGENITEDNAVTVSVEVLTPGAYAITTDSANGFYFADTGFFVSAGKQQLLLHGHGNAHGAGLFYFNVLTSNAPCGFYLPVQNTDPLAVYVLQSAVVGSTVTCSPSSVQGVYIASSPVTGTHTATVSIDVTQTGLYTIATNRVNGVSFQYSGTLTNTGVQDVLLHASGTPTAAGTFLYNAQIIGPAPLGGASCNFSVTAQ